MKAISSTEVARRFGAMQTEPVCVQSHGRPQVVMLSPAEYERFRRQDRRVYNTNALPPSLREAIAKARPSRAAAAFDDEVGK